MSDILDQTVQVAISRETTAVARAAFNVPCYVASHTAFSTRTKEYASVSSVALDFPTTHSVYKAATQFFGQVRRPPKMVVGRRQVDSVVCSVGTVTTGNVYSFVVNGTTYSYTAIGGSTQQSIIDALETAYNSNPKAGITFTDNTGSFTLAVSVAGTGWSFSVNANLNSSQNAATESWATTLTEVKFESSAFYALVTEDHTDAGILAIAAWANANNVLYGASSSSAAVKTSATDDLGSQLKALGYTRTFLLWSASASTEIPEAAWIGDRLPPVAGSAQWVYASLVGVTPDKLTDDEIANLDNKRVNSYIPMTSLNNCTRKGWVSNGTFIEETMLIDWLKSRIQERVFSRMINSLKLPSDNAGLAVIQSEIYSVLYEGVANGGIGSKPAPTVYVPDILDIDPNLRAQGVVTGIKFRARMIVSITEVVIEGVVTI